MTFLRVEQNGENPKTNIRDCRVTSIIEAMYVNEVNGPLQVTLMVEYSLQNFGRGFHPIFFPTWDILSLPTHDLM